MQDENLIVGSSDENLMAKTFTDVVIMTAVTGDRDHDCDCDCDLS
jgi:hypothetical protein